MAEPAPAALKRRLSIAFALDEQSLVRSIFAQLAETWRSTLTQEARAAGSPKTGQGPYGEDLTELSRIARRDAASVVRTHGHDLNYQINRIYEDSPTASRTDYIQALTLWANDRAVWKDRQIANMNRGNARKYAQLRFNEKNQVGEALYLAEGPPPREPICAGLMAVGLVNREFIERNPFPAHINCPHGWTVQVTRVGVPLNELWVGE